MAKAGGKFSRRGRHIAIGGKPVIFDPESEYAIQSRLEAVAERLRQQLATPPSQPRRKQAKPVQDEIRPKLRKKYPPHGKPPEKMSTSKICRQIDLDPNRHWHSVNRALGREPKK
jgi:hypothetical protein